MSFLSGLSNIFHGIGHVFDAHEDEQKKKQDQQQQQQQQSQPRIAPPQHPQNFQPIAPAQKQAPQPLANAPTNLYQGAPQAGSFDPQAPLIKAMTQQAQAQPVDHPHPQAPQPHQSLIHNIVHGALTGVKDVGSVAAGTSLGVLRAGEGLVQGVTDIPKLAVDAGTWAGDKLSGTDYKPQFVKQIDQWTDDIDKPQKWLAKKTDEAAQAYGGPGAAVYKPVQVAANVATIIPAGAALLAKAGELGNIGKVGDVANAVNDFVKTQKAASPAIQLLEKAKTGLVNRYEEVNGIHGTPDATAPAKPSVAAGVKSANPNQEVDAAKQVAAAAPPPAPAPPEIIEHAMNDHEQAALSNLNKDAKTRTLTDEESNMRTALQEKADTIDAANNPQPIGPAKATQATSTKPKSQPSAPPVSPATPAQVAGQPAKLSKVSSTPGTEPVRPLETTAPQPSNIKSSSKSPVNDGSVPQTSDNIKTAPNAPNIRPQAAKDLEEIGAKEDAANPTRTKWDKVVGKNKEHDVLSNKELNDAADRFTSTKSDAELLSDYAGDGTKKVSINSAAELAKAYSTVKRLGKMVAKGDENASKIIDDILDAAEEHVSKSGRTLNYAGSMYDTLPKEAKAAYLLRGIDKARNAAGMEVLSDAEKAAASKEITDLLAKGEDYMQVAVEAQGKIEKLVQEAKTGEGKVGNDAINQMYKDDAVFQKNKLAAEATQGKLTDAYHGLTPSNVAVGDKAGSLARSLMLTSVTGRVSDVASTSMNVLHLLTQHSVEAAMGKIANTTRAAAGKTPGKYIDTLPSPTAFVHGGEQGLQKFSGQITGKNYVSDVQKMTKSNPEMGKGQIRNDSSNKVTKFISSRAHAMAEAATNLSEGVKNTRMLQLAYQDGKKAGLTGEDLDVYAHGTALSPSKQMAAKGDKLVDEVNNMNDNPFTSGLENIAKGFDKIPVVGDTIRNLVSPFNRWVGGAAWNGVTDKNVVANVIKAGRAMVKGDSQEAVHQLAGLVTNSAGAMGAGYALAQAGVLRTTNAEGYNDDGLYLHLGNHNIPVGFFGFFAPGIIMGAATHDAMKDNSGKSTIQKIMDISGKSFSQMATSYLHNTTIGGGNALLRDTQDTIQHKNDASWGDTAVDAAGDTANTYIPGIAGDVNSAINEFNIGNLNPNHEAGLTKVTKGEHGEMNPKTGNPSTAKDVPRSVINQVINRVPVAGQKMVPRNPGVAAPDLLSRITRGDNESPEQQATKNAISTLPQDQQDKITNQLRATGGAAQYHAQKAADAAKPGPSKVKAQEVADKMKFASNNSEPVKAAVEKVQQSEEVGKFQKEGGDQEIKTIGGKTYAMVDGKATAFDTPQKAQQAIDMSKFKASDQKEQHVNGMVYQRGSNGKVTSMEQKDYDYKDATEHITSAKNSGDVTGYMDGHSKLLENITWQLNHADLTPENRAALVQKAVQSQEEVAKTEQYKGFTKPKGMDTYATPEITGAREYTPDEQKKYGGAKGYVPVIQEMGAKYGVDINALLSVAAVEGLGGGVGDGGHAFGPFQMNDAGGVLKGKFKSSAEAKAYAESPAGIEDAVKQIAAAAKGKTGTDAIKAIVNEFERPADPNGEIAKALSLYSGGKITLSPDGGSNLTANDASGSSASDKTKSNTIGSLHQMKELNFSGLAPQKLTNMSIPAIQAIKSGELIKQRAISVSKVR